MSKTRRVAGKVWHTGAALPHTRHKHEHIRTAFYHHDANFHALVLQSPSLPPTRRTPQLVYKVTTMATVEGTIHWHNDWADFQLSSVSDSHAVGSTFASVDDLTSITAPKLPTNESILCICSFDIDDSRIVICDICQIRFHGFCQGVSQPLTNWTCALCSPKVSAHGEDKENLVEWVTKLRAKLDFTQAPKLPFICKLDAWQSPQMLQVEVERQRELMLRVEHPQMRELLAILQNLGDVRQQQLEKPADHASVPCIDTRVPPAATHRSSLASDRPKKAASLKSFVSSTNCLDNCVSTANNDRPRNNLGLTGIDELDIAWLSILDQSQARTLPEYESQFATLLEHSTIDALVKAVHTTLSSADCIRLIDLLHEVALSL